MKSEVSMHTLMSKPIPLITFSRSNWSTETSTSCPALPVGRGFMASQFIPRCPALYQAIIRSFLRNYFSNPKSLRMLCFRGVLLCGASRKCCGESCNEV